MTNGLDNTYIYYVIGMLGNRFYYESIASPNKLFYNESLVIGDSITDNGNGTYSLNNTSTITFQDWVNNYANYKYKYTCGDASTSCALPRYIVTTTDTNYRYISASKKILIAKTRNGLELTDTLLVRLDELSKNRDNYGDYKYTCDTTSSTCTKETLRMITLIEDDGYKYAINRYFGQSANWNGSKYILGNVVGIESATNLNDISTHHYTCVTATETECTNVAYIYYMNSTYLFYIELENGVEDPVDELNDMLYANDVNTRDSAIKRIVDEWYYNNMLSYDNYLEETVYCNDRSITNLGGWDKDNGSVNDDIIYNWYQNYDNMTFSCTNETDQFSISNNKAKLKYKVGLPTVNEMRFLLNTYYSGTIMTYMNTGENYWLLTPGSNISEALNVGYVRTDGYINITRTSSSYGIRPVISLASGVVPASGSGTMADPYVVDLTVVPGS